MKTLIKTPVDVIELVNDELPSAQLAKSSRLWPIMVLPVMLPSRAEPRELDAACRIQRDKLTPQPSSSWATCSRLRITIPALARSSVRVSSHCRKLFRARSFASLSSSSKLPA